MGIVAKNIIVNNNIVESKKEEPKAPPTKTMSFHEKLQELRNPKPQQKQIQEVVKEPEEIKSHYHDVHEGDLHKLHNTKSEYLNDMIGFKL